MAPDERACEPPEITITIGPDGRVHFLDLTPELLAVAAAMCPESAHLRALQAAYEAMRPGQSGGICENKETGAPPSRQRLGVAPEQAAYEAMKPEESDDHRTTDEEAQAPQRQG